MKNSPFASLLRPELSTLTAYVPHGGSFAVRLDANEPPDMLSASARAHIQETLGKIPWNRYPDARAWELRLALGAHLGCKPEELLVGCGSDEIIALLLTALAHPRKDGPAVILTTTPTFVMYRVSAVGRGMRSMDVPLDATWDLDVRGMLRALEMARPSVVFIASPNNPTGGLMSKDRLVAVIEAAPDSIVVVDEAYIAYAGCSQRDLRRYPNVVMFGTLAKVGFAALRVGWMEGPAELVAELDKVRQPYNLSVPAQRVATLVLRELRSEIDAVVDLVTRERDRVSERLTALGHTVAPSSANFLWVGTSRPAEAVFNGLAERGVLVRSFHATGGRLAHRLRVTIGLPAENDRFLEAMAACS